MNETEWVLFVNAIKVGHQHETNADYLHEMKSRILLRFPDAVIRETLAGRNNRMVHQVSVKCDQRTFGFHVELPLSGEWTRKA